MPGSRRGGSGRLNSAPAPTQRDVAAAAGVSPKTVSNVVNGFGYVAEQTLAKVQQAIDQLGYRPNPSAQSLRRGRSNLIALAIPSLRNPYFAELADLIVSAAEQQGKTVLVDCTHGKREHEKMVLEGFQHRVVDGLILCPHALKPADVRTRQDRTPLVMLGERLGRAADCVAIDSRAAADAATSHLAQLGRRRIAVLGFEGSATNRVGTLRLQGYRDALQRAHVRESARLVAMLPAEKQDPEAAVIEATRALLRREPKVDGIFCFNDLMAMSAMHHLLSAGVRVPEDVALVGIDDIALARLSWPGLTTIAPDKQRIAELAVNRLVDRIEARDGAIRRSAVDFRLVVRGSTVTSAHV